MRYVLQVPDINNFDFETLKGEIKTSGFSLKEIYPGNGVLIFDIDQILDDTQKASLHTIVLNHKPVWFQNMIVRCAEDVDKITAMRIRAIFDGQPVDEQFKIVFEMLVNIFSSINNATSFADLKTQIQYQDFLDKRSAYIAQGKAFKIGKGW